MEALLAAAVRGDQVEWPSAREDAEQQFLEAARRHGVLPLVARQLRRTRNMERWPESLRTTIAERARQYAVVQHLQQTELVALLKEFAARGVRPLLFKGAALAHTHYPYPCLRPRNDVDLLVADAAVDSARLALLARGYAPLEHVTGRLVTSQQTFVRDAGRGVRHACDLHWRIANRPAFAQLLEWDELQAGAQSVRALDDLADAPGTPYALLIACMHRVAHHYDSSELVWIYDIHLLASSMTDAEAARFRTLALEKGLAGICRRGLTLAQRHFATVLPPPLRDLEALGREPLAGYMRERFRLFDVLVSDLKALRSWRARWQLLHEHLFPAPAYLQAERVRLGRGPLSWLYARRIVGGAFRWLRASGPQL